MSIIFWGIGTLILSIMGYFMVSLDHPDGTKRHKDGILYVLEFLGLLVLAAVWPVTLAVAIVGIVIGALTWIPCQHLVCREGSTCCWVDCNKLWRDCCVWNKKINDAENGRPGVELTATGAGNRMEAANGGNISTSNPAEGVAAENGTPSAIAGQDAEIVDQPPPYQPRMEA